MYIFNMTHPNENGFHEVGIKNTTEIFGNIAHVFDSPQNRITEGTGIISRVWFDQCDFNARVKFT